MDNDIVVYTVGFMTARLSVVLLFGYAIYLTLRGGRAAARCGALGHGSSALARVG